MPLRWKLDALKSHAGARSATFVYENSSPRLRLAWKWVVRSGSGPIEHTITIENLSGAELWMPLQDSFRFRFAAGNAERLRHSYVEKGAGKPSDVGTHEVAVPVGYGWQGRSSTYARDEDEREVIPWFMVERDNPAHDGWYAGIEFSGRTRLTLARDAAIGLRRAWIESRSGTLPYPSAAARDLHYTDGLCRRLHAVARMVWAMFFAPG